MIAVTASFGRSNGRHGSSTHEINQCFERFGKLQPQTAKKVIEFYRLRERAATHSN